MKTTASKAVNTKKKKFAKNLLIVIATLLVFVAVFFLALYITFITEGDKEAANMAMVFLIVVLIPMIICWVAWAKKNKEDQPLNTATVSQESKQKNKPIVKTKFPVVSLLGIPEGSECKLEIFPEYILFSALGQSIKLAQSKVTNVSCITKKQIHSQYVSSVGGAVAGGLVFGAIGAAIGGSAKAKRYTDKTKFLIFTYKKDSESNYIVLLVPENRSNKAAYIADIYKQRNKATSSTIEL